ncbi:MAG: mercuric reductase [Sphingopyxis granuli]|jgi:mercuric ion transport protein|uniref:Mercuric ion transport protein n=2 Tax=Sphingomonadales TaxID=204457 RepID=A0A397PAB4_9SPHN|nr:MULTISPECIES: mercuric reductase [Sphingomonadaceae]MBN9506657.1 mercuric reductase [Altererythrobacter sp.]OJU60500.1 MAG: mercuric reductase [Altererythrobacter sp. 66-12]PTD27671.1 mercuric reductase [Sphingomonas fennica]RIA44117.1 mercuric ion transport protein [Hephaestia caeni]
MSIDPRDAARLVRARGAAALTLGGIAAAFSVASCCALPVVLMTAGLSAAWLGGIAMVAAPYRVLLLWLSTLSLAGGALLLWRTQRSAIARASDRVCTPGWLRLVLLIGLISGAILLWLGYSYV